MGWLLIFLKQHLEKSVSDFVPGFQSKSLIFKQSSTSGLQCSGIIDMADPDDEGMETVSLSVQYGVRDTGTCTG